jgi:hypothetical protein
MINGDPQRIELDVDQVFMLYAAFCGDVAKTAHSSGIPQDKVVALAVEHQWPERIKSLVDLTKGSKPGDVERGINRAMNFVQAHRYRIFVEGVMRALMSTSSTEEGLRDTLTVKRFNKKGECINESCNMRPLADLASAMEKIHWMTYQALNDSPQERAKRVEKPADDVSQADVHAKIAATLAEMRTNSPKAHLEAAQVELATHIAPASTSGQP